MTFSERIRQLRNSRSLTQRELAGRVGINFTYLSKIENGKLDASLFPSKDTIRKLAGALEADTDELLLLARKIPDAIRDRVIERPDAFRRLANLNDKMLDRVLAYLDQAGKREGR
jgi:transcriptional regulator with XRE-family HTH domain